MTKLTYTSEATGMITFTLLFTGFGTKEDKTSFDVINCYTFTMFSLKERKINLLYHKVNI